jgi:hypothetical protein
VTEYFQNQLVLIFKVQKNHFDLIFRFDVDIKIAFGSSLRMSALQLTAAMDVISGRTTTVVRLGYWPK